MPSPMSAWQRSSRRRRLWQYRNRERLHILPDMVGAAHRYRKWSSALVGVCQSLSGVPASGPRFNYSPERLPSENRADRQNTAGSLMAGSGDPDTHAFSPQMGRGRSQARARLPQSPVSWCQRAQLCACGSSSGGTIDGLESDFPLVPGPDRAVTRFSRSRYMSKKVPGTSKRVCRRSF